MEDKVNMGNSTYEINRVNLICETKSNLFIGGMNETFEIGGIDMYTITRDGKPYIPGSSLKGVFRNMFREVYNECELVEKIFLAYFDEEIKKINNVISEIENSNEDIKNKNLLKEKIEKTKKNIENLKLNIKVEDIFGISGLNNHPRLIFSDFEIFENDKVDYFSIDAKNTIEYRENEITSIPRIYKTVRKGVKFSGNISLEKIPKELKNELYDMIINSLNNFNNGNYRIGNSQSRGYGLVEFTKGISG